MRFNYKMLRNDESYEYLYSPSSFGVCLPPSDPIKHCETARGLATGNIPIKELKIDRNVVLGAKGRMRFNAPIPEAIFLDNL